MITNKTSWVIFLGFEMMGAKNYWLTNLNGDVNEKQYF